MRSYWWIGLVVVAFTLASCGSSEVTQNISAEERFALGKQKFDKGDYVEATAEFEIIKLQFPGSGVADDAQFYLAECHFQKEEYLLAAEEYQALKRNMQTSSFVPLAQYKIAMCYYNLTPRSPLDQKYTRKAIEEFQAFVEYYPKDEHAPDAEAKIRELNGLLAQRLYETAQLYMKLEYYKSATIYFNTVTEKYHDTEFAEPALLGKVRALIVRKRYSEAKQNIDKFFERFPRSAQTQDAESLRNEIDEQLKKSSSAIGSPREGGVEEHQHA